LDTYISAMDCQENENSLENPGIKMKKPPIFRGL